MCWLKASSLPIMAFGKADAMLRNHPFSRQIAARYCKGQTGVSFGAIARRAVIVWRRPAKPLKRQAAVKPVVTVMAGVVMTPVVHKHFVAGPKFGSPQTKIFQSLHHRDGPLHVHSTAQSRSSLTKVFMQNAPLPDRKSVV